MLKTTATIALLLCASASAWAQRGMEDMFSRKVNWYPTVEAAMSGGGEMNELERRRLRFLGMEPTERKYVFVYVRPITEDKELDVWNNSDISTASRGAWAFVKMDFDKENAWQKAWGITRAPAIIGCDLHGNDFDKRPSAALDAVRTLLKTVPDAVTRYQTALKVNFGKAMDALKQDEERGLKLLVDFCLAAKPGYKESAEAGARLAEVSESALRKGELAEAVSVDVGVEYHDGLVKALRNTAPGIHAEIRLARLDHERGNVQAALQRLQKVLKMDARTLKKEMDEAAVALAEISKSGEAKVDAALALADRAAGKEALRKLAKDYAGTDAGKRAADASK
jgi:thioredoxin-like negative regulator of GroEL